MKKKSNKQILKTFFVPLGDFMSYFNNFTQAKRFFLHKNLQFHNILLYLQT